MIILQYYNATGSKQNYALIYLLDWHQIPNGSNIVDYVSVDSRIGLKTLKLPEINEPKIFK